MAGFIIAFATIQLLEAGIWVSITDDNRSMNDLMTRLIPIALLAQPLIQTYMGYRYTGNTFLKLFSFVLLGIFIYAWYRIGVSKPGQYHSVVGSQGHLVWKNEGSSTGVLGGKWIILLYLLGIFAPLLFMENGKGIALLTVGVITALYSLSMTRSEEFSSYWCFTAVAFSIIALFI